MLCLTLLVQCSLITSYQPQPALLFRHNTFKLVDKTKAGRENKQFSFFTEQVKDDSEKIKPELSDPAEYYAKIQRKVQRRKKHGSKLKRIQGSYSSYKKSKNNQLNYAFLKPEVYQAEESKDCKPASPISAFTFMNFAMAAGSVAANIIANVNDNNNNNNNNNNDNNDNTNNFNIENNSNNANNANTIMLPVGRKRRKRMMKDVWKNYQNIFNQSLVNWEAAEVLELCEIILKGENLICTHEIRPRGVVAQTFYCEMKNKLC